jgi:signal transduction histidine kinase
MNTARAEQRSQTVDIRSCPGDLLVDADETALTMMLSHLLENAVGHTQAGGTIILSAGRGDGTICMTISDNGPGVAESDLERIFEPFEQVGRGTADHSAGTGLGLPIVKGLAELHDGTLVVESVYGAGFTAILELPSA